MAHATVGSIFKFCFSIWNDLNHTAEDTQLYACPGVQKNKYYRSPPLQGPTGTNCECFGQVSKRAPHGIASPGASPGGTPSADDTIAHYSSIVSSVKFQFSTCNNFNGYEEEWRKSRAKLRMSRGCRTVESTSMQHSLLFSKILRVLTVPASRRRARSTPYHGLARWYTISRRHDMIDSLR